MKYAGSILPSNAVLAAGVAAAARKAAIDEDAKDSFDVTSSDDDIDDGTGVSAGTGERALRLKQCWMCCIVITMATLRYTELQLRNGPLLL